MPTAPPSPAPGSCAPAAASALQAAWRRVRGELPRTLLVLATLSLGIALFLTLLEGRGFVVKLVYSLCIGLCCGALVAGTRLALAWLTDATRRARGLPLLDTAPTSPWQGVIPGALLAVVAGPPAGLWLADQITGYRSQSLLDFGPSARVTLAVTLVATVVTVLVVSTLERLAAARTQAEIAQRQAAEHQLRLLQSQLEPHMLFNTLANLRVLIGVEPARAQAMLDRLIGFLRATLAASRSAAHPLAREFAHLDDYLALMAVRMGPRLAVQLNLPAELAPLPLPALLLQPLVENAIQHGLEPQVEGGLLAVSARREDGRLQLQVRDTGVGVGAGPAAVGTNFGLAQVRARLATLYGERATLELRPADDGRGGTLATITLPLE
ncbi:MAG: sensor histidine kinase [Leptothrix sp. (in: Bacteria)]|nr:sensor histidine kinase [Leptothrix sp. (in: b-proteobacteria)]